MAPDRAVLSIDSDMVRADGRRDRNAFGVRARLLLLGVVGAFVLLGALGATSGGASAAGPTQPGAHSTYIVQHEATVAPTSIGPARSHRLVVPGALLVAVSATAFGALRIGSRERRRGRRRVEQFNVRRRGPPHLLVAH